MSFMIEDDSVLPKYYEIWNKIKKTLNTKLYNKPVYDKKYMKAKVKDFNFVIQTFEVIRYQKKVCITIV